MRTEFTWKVEQPNSLIERNRRFRHRRQERRTFGLFLAGFLWIRTELYVGTKPAMNDIDVLSRRRMDAKRLRSFRFGANQRHRLANGEIGWCEGWRQGCGIAGSTLSQLEKRPIAPDANANRQPGIGILTHVDQRIVRALFSLLCGVFKAAMMPIAAIELSDEVQPFAFAAVDLSE